MREKRLSNASSKMGAISELINSLMRPRTYVRNRAALLALSMLVAAACDDSPTGQAGNGTLRVTVAGHNPAGANAGQVRNEGPLGTLVFTIPTAGVLEQQVPAGTYTIVYTPPQGYVMADGQTFERDVTVAAGGSAQE